MNDAAPTSRRLLLVSEQASDEVPPTSAYLHLLLSSDALFSGRAAFEKARELKRLAVALAARDVPESAISLEGATMEVDTGIFTRSSRVAYRVRVHVKNVERVADALDAVAESKEAVLTSMTWDYGDGAPPALLARAAKSALAKARAVADALGVTIENVHRIREEALDAPFDGALGGFGAQSLPRAVGAAKLRSSIASEAAGLELAPRRKMTVKVTLELEVAGRPA